MVSFNLIIQSTIIIVGYNRRWTYGAIVDVSDVFARVNLTEGVCDRTRHDRVLRADQTDGEDHECRVEERMEAGRKRNEHNQDGRCTAQWHADELGRWLKELN